MSIKIGEVIGVEGVSITIKMFENSNKDVFFFSGKKFKGVSIREHLFIQRGFVDVVCVVEGEFLDEKKIEREGDKIIYTRKVKVKPIGYFRNEKFCEGIKFLPMIKDPAFLISENKKHKIYTTNNNTDFYIGKMLKEELPFYLPWKNLFNTHIGVLGTTGSGKSNTLTKLYTSVLEAKSENIKGKSQFVILDFNGEYTNEQILPKKDKRIIAMNTENENENEDDKFKMNEDQFWDVQILGILFKATTNTQIPFLRRVVDGRKKNSHKTDSLKNYIQRIFKEVFSSTSQHRNCLELLKLVAKKVDNKELTEKISSVSWNSTLGVFYTNKIEDENKSKHYFDNEEKYKKHFNKTVSEIKVDQFDQFEELVLRTNICLCFELLQGHVQFEHIQPLLKRIDSHIPNLKKVISVEKSGSEEKILTVISLKNCNSEIKKIVPLLIVKQYYEQHKKSVKSPPDKTLHLIIDEAHNILSEQSKRESESWKDYRLELFEEIIKEGRKFGLFLTIASQRPADISPTIISQVHNFFIHRLVSERDLNLIDNTINTLDRLSRESIPTLPQGGCVVTGTSFSVPMMIQVHLLEKDQQPDSSDVNLENLWSGSSVGRAED